MASEPVGRFVSISNRGLRFDSPPMRLWEKAKRLGTWNPAEIDFAGDRNDWLKLDEGERDLLLRLASLFEAGEESVTIELLPLISAVAAEGRLEEEIYLTSFLWEEAKHVEAFRRFFDLVAVDHSDLERFHGPCYQTIFYDELPRAMARLKTDASPEALARASVTYNMIVEGVLAETGYHVYHRMLEENGILPATMKMIGLLKVDESRHLAYGVYLLSRLVAEHGDPIWHVIEERMNELLEPAIGVIHEVFASYDPDAVPFGLELEPFVDFAMRQFQSRVHRIERARDQSLSEIEDGTALAAD